MRGGLLSNEICLFFIDVLKDEGNKYKNIGFLEDVIFIRMYVF